MDRDFLDGIDEHFEQLMKLHGNGRRNGARNGSSKGDRTLPVIMDALEGLSKAEREEVLSFIHSLKDNSDRP